jgi:hypothetical protein
MFLYVYLGDFSNPDDMWNKTHRNVDQKNESEALTETVIKLKEVAK